jgi:hypothetical protein
MTTEPIPSNRDRKLLERLTVALGEPTVAANRFWVEGTYPWIVFGTIVGVGILRSALGGVVGILLGFLIARVVTFRRAPGFSLSSLVAITSTRIIVIKGSRPTGKLLGEWPVNTVRVSWRHKALTNAFVFDFPDGRHVRLENSGLGARKRADNLVAHLDALGILTESVEPARVQTDDHGDLADPAFAKRTLVTLAITAAISAVGVLVLRHDQNFWFWVSVIGLVFSAPMFVVVALDHVADYGPPNE